MAVRVLASTPEAQCFQLSAHLATVIPALPLLSDAGRTLAKKSIEDIVNYIIAKASNKPKEADKALDVAMAAINSNHDVTMKALDLVQNAI